MCATSQLMTLSSYEISFQIYLLKMLTLYSSTPLLYATANEVGWGTACY